MTERRWNVGPEPSLRCAFDRHEDCQGRNCTCRCHYMNGPGIEPVEEPLA
jgi:hypothetical protein